MDSHGATNDNILWDKLHPAATIIRGGKNTPLYFLEGLDGETDAVFLVGWHDKAGDRGLLAHTFFRHPFIKINGRLVGYDPRAARHDAHGDQILRRVTEQPLIGDQRLFLG